MGPRLDPPNPLSDPDGIWCAICLDYGRAHDRLVSAIPAEMRRRFTSIIRRVGRQLELPFADLYTHADCLAAMPIISRIPDVILDYVGNASRLHDDEVDRAAKTFHDQGLYPVSAALKDVLLRRQTLDRRAEHASQTLARKIASLAGIGNPTRGVALSDAFVRHHRKHPAILLHVANWHANFGRLRYAEAVLDLADEERRGMHPSAKQALQAHYLMRLAQVRRKPAFAREAIRTARDDAYMFNTAYILAGQTHAPEQPSRARAYFDAVLAKGLNASWLYRAESLFGIGCLMLRGDTDVKEAYKFLAAAQYIWATLRLQGTPHLSMHPDLPQSALTPASVVYYDAHLARISKGERLALRQIAVLESGVRNRLLSTLTLSPAVDGPWPDTLEVQRRSRVLVLGPDTSPSALQTLRGIISALAEHGYTGILVKDQPDLVDETNEGKVLRLAAMSCFIMLEHSTPAGQIDELQLLAPRGYTVAILHRKGVQATWMQADYDIPYRLVKYFSYERLAPAVRGACRWAEATLREKEVKLRSRYTSRGTPSAA